MTYEAEFAVPLFDLTLKNLLGTWELNLMEAAVLLGMEPDDGWFAGKRGTLSRLLNGKVDVSANMAAGAGGYWLGYR